MVINRNFIFKTEKLRKSCLLMNVVFIKKCNKQKNCERDEEF